MANDPNIKIKLAATGGDQAAKEVAKVETAVSDLATETKKLPAELVPAWDQTTKAVEGASEASDTAASSTKDLDDALGDVKSRIEEARAKIEEFKQATEQASGDDGGGGIDGMIGRFGPLLAQATLVVGAINGIVQVLERLDQQGEAAVQRASEIGDAIGSALGENDTDREALARALEKTIAPASTLADELGRLADNNEFANDAARDTASLANSAAEAFDNYKRSLIDLKVARGEMTKEEAAAAKGEIDIEATRRDMAAKTKAAADAQTAAKEEYRAALEAERQATQRLAEAGKEAQNAGGRERERLFNAAQQSTNAGIIGGLSPFDPTAASQTIDLAGGEEAVRQMIQDMEGTAGYIARWRLSLGQSVESVLGAGERSEISRMMADDAEAEMKAAETNRQKAQENAAKVQEERARELEAVRKIREAAEARERQAQFDVSKVAEENRITEGLTIPAMENRTQSELAQIEARKAEEKRREEERLAKEAERQRLSQQNEQADLAAVSLAQNIRDQVAGANPNADPNGLIPLLTQIATLFQNGTNQTEQANVMAQLGSAIQKLSADQAASRALLTQIQEQIRNNPAR